MKKIVVLLVACCLHSFAADLYFVDKESRAWKRLDNKWVRVPFDDLPNPNDLGPRPADIGFPTVSNSKYGELQFDANGNVAVEVRAQGAKTFHFQLADGSFVPFDVMVWSGHDKASLAEVVTMPGRTGFIAVTTDGEVLSIQPPRNNAGPVLFDVSTLLPPKSAWKLAGTTENSVILEKFDGKGFVSLNIQSKELKPVTLPNGADQLPEGSRLQTGGYLSLRADQGCPVNQSRVQRHVRQLQRQ